MRVHLVRYSAKDVHCGASSIFIQSTTKPELVTCKVCKELHEINIGKRETMSFGGDLDSGGKPRKNQGRQWRKGKF